MEPIIKKLLIAFLGPPSILIPLGLFIPNLYVFEIGLGYIMLWFVFIAFLYNYFAHFNSSYSRWKGQDIKNLAQVEPIKITVGGNKFLIGDIIKSPKTPKEKAPVIVMCHGLGGSRKDFYMIGLALIEHGYAWLSYDSRGHGETKFGEKYDSLYIIKDFSKVMDFIESRPDLDHKRIVAIGASMGASVVLNEAYLDPRVDFIIGICAWADFQATATRKLHGLRERMVKLGYKIMGINLDPTNLQNRFVSPIKNSFNKKKGFFDHPIPWEVDNEYRVVLAHCKDDHVINYENFIKNTTFLKLPENNKIDFEWGDHAFAGQETALMGKIIYWLVARGY